VRSAAVGAALIMMSACAGNGDSAHAPGADTAAVEIRGVVAITGSDPLPRIVLRTEEGGVRLHSDEPHLLKRLSGVEVAVRGSRRDDGFHVTEVEPLRVDGEPVIAGVVEEDGEGGLRLRRADGSTVRLLYAPAGLRPGETVWVQGPGEVRVQRFGVYRDREEG
jgi:hypothetical protein